MYQQLQTQCLYASLLQPTSRILIEIVVNEKARAHRMARSRKVPRSYVF